jgi:hypothetical protein
MIKKICIILAVIFALISVTKICLYRNFDVDTNSLLNYCKQNGYSEDYCIYVDFSKPQGVDRFCIYDFKKNKIIAKSLCANGYGVEKNIFNKTFSNKPGSNYSSLGKYRIGNLRAMSNPFFKEGYTVYGLDSTNSNAYKRAILIHKGNPPFETFPLPCMPVSKGCFAVSSKMMKKIGSIKSKTKKPILLYAYR